MRLEPAEAYGGWKTRCGWSANSESMGDLNRAREVRSAIVYKRPRRTDCRKWPEDRRGRRCAASGRWRSAVTHKDTGGGLLGGKATTLLRRGPVRRGGVQPVPGQCRGDTQAIFDKLLLPKAQGAGIRFLARA